jgi:hypothetical protein
MDEWAYPWPSTPTAMPPGSVTVSVLDSAGTPVSGAVVTLTLTQPWPRSPQAGNDEVPSDGVWLDTNSHQMQGTGWQREVEITPTAPPNQWRWIGPSGMYRGTFTTL